MRGRVRTRALRARGGRVITAGSTGSTPRDWAGGPSMRMSMKSMLDVLEEYDMANRNDQLTDPKDLHGIEGILEAEEGAEED